MKKFPKLILDGNEAVARIAHKTNEVCAIYPITPSSPMGEHAEAYSAKNMTNIYGDIPNVVEMQSEGGAAGAVHGGLQGGALTTTFTASQGLLLMIPNMYKIAGELLPTVFHIAARTLATHALSIFGDHSDVMATRQTGFSMLFGGSVQEAHDFALISQVATLKSRVPFLNIFDGFRTSHEIQKIDGITDDIITDMMPFDKVQEHRERALNPKNPVLRGSSQNPDMFFQAREAANLYYDRTPAIVQETMDEFYKHTGRKYELFDYVGHPEAERVIILMGSGTGPVLETIDTMVENGEKVGALIIRLYRPFDMDYFINKLPSTVTNIAVMDRTKESGAIGDPVYLDVVTAFVESGKAMPNIVGGRYGLSSKEFTPAMVKAIYDNLAKETPKNHFTVGIIDDVTKTHLEVGDTFQTKKSTFNSMFYGLGSDGTVSANKNSIKIIGDTTDGYAQGYFVYDSNKAGSQTISHLRFGPDPIYSTYLINSADFIACHQYNYIEKYDMIAKIKKGGTFLLNSPYSKDDVWAKLPKKAQEQIIEKELKFYVIDATKVAQDAKLGRRTNTILQTCFFAISGILPKEDAIKRIKDAIVKSYSHKGDAVVQMNFNGVDKAIENLHQVDYPKTATSTIALKGFVTEAATDYVKEVLAMSMAGKGDLLPVGVFLPDGTFPTGTTQFQKRDIADFIPTWDDNELCTQCNKCVMVCPHSAIRAKVVTNEITDSFPTTLTSVAAKGRPFDKETESYVLQVSPYDCTGCNLCVAVCPAISKEKENFKAINLHDKADVAATEALNWDHFIELPDYDRKKLATNNVKGAQFLEPLFEFSGACPGCGETPYIKLVTQLWGDNLVVANATGCSSIYGGNMPTTPYTKNAEGRGPAWANSLFEDNAEFGLGIRLALNTKQARAQKLLTSMKSEVGAELVTSILENEERDEITKAEQFANIEKLNAILDKSSNKNAAELLSLSDNLSRKHMWIFGGDGWAYDIGYGGLDHILSSGENINILVMDTEVYSNTGGQASKATPIGASAKFALKGKKVGKKDLALQAVSYGNVYVAQVASGAKDAQTVKAFQEAVAYDGPSLIIAYSHCIEHGYDMGMGAEHQKVAVETGYWPLFRFNPENAKGKKFKIDSKAPKGKVEDFMYKEARFVRVKKLDEKFAAQLLSKAQDGVDDKWERLQIFSNL
ncbi:MAG TPA: pyruvate:ferredoxin (flavodoxin) oxidoreductase [Lutibacter sp.]|nr:pyruvate:ferredoxin (flavodoxin) oxidoreductase [Lutibacter sp.]